MVIQGTRTHRTLNYTRHKILRLLKHKILRLLNNLDYLDYDYTN